jgi:hypothetical protein
LSEEGQAWAQDGKNLGATCWEFSGDIGCGLAALLVLGFDLALCFKKLAKKYEPDDPRQKLLPEDVGTLCQSRIDGFTKFKSSPDGTTDASPYTDSITMFYRNNSGRLNLTIDSMMMGLRDSTYAETERRHNQNGAGQ